MVRALFMRAERRSGHSLQLLQRFGVSTMARQDERAVRLDFSYQRAVMIMETMLVVNALEHYQGFIWAFVHDLGGSHQNSIHSGVRLQLFVTLLA
jgi:hypothetical protein